MSSIILEHTHQGFVVSGGNLPRGSCWAVCDTYGEAAREAMEIAYDLDLPLDDKVPPCLSNGFLGVAIDER